MFEHDKQSARSLGQPTPVEPENFQVTVARRRFLKGLGIGLPAVMTLRSGALMAQTSSQCLVNRQTPNPSPDAFGPIDNWFRQSSPAYTAFLYKKKNSSDQDWLVTADNTNYYSAKTGDLVNLSDYDTANGSLQTASDYHALCYVNNQGWVVACEPENSAQLPAPATCAASFALG